jgi:tyrosine-protein kinase Etk/Wzc
LETRAYGAILEVGRTLPLVQDEHPSTQQAKLDIDLLDILIILAKRRWFILKTTLTLMVITAIGLLIYGNTFESTAVIMPPRQEQSISGLLSGQLGSLAALGGAGNIGSGFLKNPNDIYIGLLESRTVTDHLVNRFDLKRRFKQKYMAGASKSLLTHSKITLEKDGLIRIAVTTDNADFSSELANGFVEELHDINTHLALTDSSQRRAFFEDQLNHEKVSLANAESSFQEMQKKTGLLIPGQADIIARNIASIRAEITVREAELESLKAFATDQNPDYVRLNSQVISLRKQLSQFENNEKSMTPGDIEVPTAKIPAASQEYLRRYREVRLHEAIYELLVKQFEAAKIDEAKTAPVIQVVDRAFPPEHKTGPPRILITLGAGLVSLIVLSFWTILSYGYRVAKKDSLFRSKIDDLALAFSQRS